MFYSGFRQVDMIANPLSPLLNKRWLVGSLDNVLQVQCERLNGGWWHITHISDDGTMYRCLGVSDSDIRIVGNGKMREINE